MGRVNRLMERRALRRAADQALLTALTSHSDAAEQPGGAPDQDFEYRSADPITEPIPVADVGDLAPEQPADYAWDDQDDALPDADDELPAETVAVASAPVDVYDLVPDQPKDAPTEDDPVSSEWVEARDPLPEPLDDYRWDDNDPVPPDPVEVRPLRARPLAETAVVPPALDFTMSDDRPWYRMKPVAATLVAAVVVAVLCGGWLVLRSPSTTAGQSTNEAPSTGAPPAPTKAQPTAVSAPQPPPPPAPPPPPPLPPPPQTDEPVYSAPQRQYSEPRRSAPPPAEKPRTDVTRAPISVAPDPKPVPGSDSSTPGDGRDAPRRRGCFGFC